MKLIYVRAARSRGYLTLGLSDGTENKYAYTLAESDYAEIGSPLSGATLDSGALEVIRECDERYRATLTALRILAYGDNSQRNLYNKLTSRGISKEIASATVSDMLSQGYMDEARQIRRLIISEANQALTGPRKIMAKLRAKGYSGSAISSVMDELVSSGEIDFSRSAEKLIAKKLTRGATDEEKKKLLYKNGYGIC